MISMKIRNAINKMKANRIWRKKNKHNQTRLLDRSSLNSVVVGNYTYGDLNVFTNGNDKKLHIGSFCSIGPNVTFVLCAEHRMDCISTFPFRTKLLNEIKNEAISKGDIVIDDDVWICCNSTILSGVHIGQGAIVAAGAVVISDVPPYAVVGGVPAKVLKYRFKGELIEELVKVDFGKLTKEMARDNVNKLYEKLNNASQLDWLPKRD